MTVYVWILFTENVKMIREIRQPPVRPNLDLLEGIPIAVKNELRPLIEECWQENPAKRPSSDAVQRRLQRIIGKRKDGLVEEVLERAAGHAEELEHLVNERTHELHTEKHKIQALLFQILPRYCNIPIVL